MARHDWYRNEKWNATIDAAFHAKLARAHRRTRPQYLKIQASYLTSRYPEAALTLIDEYFATGSRSAWRDCLPSFRSFHFIPSSQCERLRTVSFYIRIWDRAIACAIGRIRRPCGAPGIAQEESAAAGSHFL